MALFGRKRTTVGLDIGSGLVKVAVVDLAALVPLALKATAAGPVADQV